MAQRSDEIVEHIEHERHNLGRNLDELQNRIASTVDWRTQFDRHPMLILGLAMGGGLLLGTMVGGTRRDNVSRRSYLGSSSGLGAGSLAGAGYGAGSYESTSSGYGSGSYGSGSYGSPGSYSSGSTGSTGSASYGSGTESSSYPTTGSPSSTYGSSGSRSGMGSSGYGSSSPVYGSGGSSYGSRPEPWSGSGGSRYRGPESSGAMRGLFSGSSEGVSYQRSKAMDTFDNIKGALVGYIAAQARDYLNQVLPGFTKHYDETAARNQGNRQRQSGESYESGRYQRGSRDDRTESALGRDRSQETGGEYGTGRESGANRGQTGGSQSGSPSGSQFGGSRQGSQSGSQTGQQQQTGTQPSSGSGSGGNRQESTPAL